MKKHSTESSCNGALTSTFSSILRKKCCICCEMFESTCFQNDDVSERGGAESSHSMPCLALYDTNVAKMRSGIIQLSFVYLFPGNTNSFHKEPPWQWLKIEENQINAKPKMRENCNDILTSIDVNRFTSIRWETIRGLYCSRENHLWPLKYRLNLS